MTSFNSDYLDVKRTLLNDETTSVEFIGKQCSVTVTRQMHGGWQYAVNVGHFTRYFYNAQVTSKEEARAAIAAVHAEHEALVAAAKALRGQPLTYRA